MLDVIQNILSFFELGLRVVIFVEKIGIVLLLLFAAFTYVVRVYDGWCTADPANVEYPMFNAVALLIVLLITEIYIWPAGRFQDTITISIFLYVLFGYSCIGSLVWTAIPLRNDTVRMPSLHFAGAVILGTLIVCFG